MFKSKIIEKLLFGNMCNVVPPGKSTTFIFPGTEEGEENIEFKFAGADGIILALLKKIKKMETKIWELENRKKWPKLTIWITTKR